MLCRELSPQCAPGGSPRFPGSDLGDQRTQRVRHNGENSKIRNVTFIMGKPEKTLLKYDNKKKMRKYNVTTTGRKNRIYIFSQQSAFCEQDVLDNDDNGFWYFDAWSVRLASAQSASIWSQWSRWKALQKMQRENMETLGTPELFYVWGLEVLGTIWITLGTWPFIFLAQLGTQLDFIPHLPGEGC